MDAFMKKMYPNAYNHFELGDELERMKRETLAISQNVESISHPPAQPSEIPRVFTPPTEPVGASNGPPTDDSPIEPAESTTGVFVAPAENETAMSFGENENDLGDLANKLDLGELLTFFFKSEACVYTVSK